MIIPFAFPCDFQFVDSNSQVYPIWDTWMTKNRVQLGIFLGKDIKETFINTAFNHKYHNLRRH